MSKLCLGFRLCSVTLQGAQILEAIARFFGYSSCDYRRVWYYSCTIVPGKASPERIHLSEAWALECFSRSRVSRWGPYAVQQLSPSSNALYGEVSCAPELPQHGVRLREFLGCLRDLRSYDRGVGEKQALRTEKLLCEYACLHYLH